MGTIVGGSVGTVGLLAVSGSCILAEVLDLGHLVKLGEDLISLLVWAYFSLD